jgi:hypothetical protein
MKLPKKDYTGQTINNRTVIRFSHWSKGNDPLWSVRCKCGTEFDSLTQDLKRSECRGCWNISHRKRPFESLYNAFVQKASKRYEVTITYAEFVEFTVTKSCYYCDHPVEWLEWQTRKKGKLYRGHVYNLDRTDNSIGYTKENCVVCCKRCNFGKGTDFTHDEWKQLGAVIRTWKEKDAS